MRFRNPVGRDILAGAGVLFVLINLTLLPFVWGDRSLRDSATIQSLYVTGSRMPAPAIQPVYRDFDAGASAWQSEPWFALEHDIVFSEHVAPLWNPYSAFGTPLAANMQSQPFSPFAWVAIAQTSARTYDIFVMLRFYAAGVFALLFLRLFVPFLPALLGGASFMYAGYFWLFVTMPEISVEVTLPAMLYCTELVMRRPTTFRTGLLALTLALAIVGGMPESILLALATVSAYALYRLCDRSLRERRLKSAVALVTASALGAGISSIALLPFFEYLPLSFNAHSGTFTGLATDAFSASAFASYLSPLLLGPPWNDILMNFHGATGVRGFFGVSAIFLAGLAVASRLADLVRRAPSKMPIAFFTSIAVFCLLKRYGVPPANWLGLVPGFRLVNFTKYEEAELAFALAALAAFGLAALLERKLSVLELALPALIPLAFLQYIFSAYRQQAASLSDFQWYFTNALLCSLALLACCALLAVWNARTERRFHDWIGIAILALLVIEVHCSYIVPMLYVIDGEPAQRADALDGTPYLSFLRAHAADRSRFISRDNILYPNWSAPYAIHDVRGVDAMYDRHYLAFVRAFTSPVDNELQDKFTGTETIDYGRPLLQRFLQLSSIRFVAYTAPIPGRPPDTAHVFRDVFSQPGVRIAEFARPLPRISVYRHVRLARDDDAALASITSPAFDPTTEAVAESAAADRGLLELENQPRSPVIGGLVTSDRSRFVEGTFATPSKAMAVLNDTYYPGWQARVDGRPAPIVRSNYLFRGVVVEPGKHTISFSYEPVSFRYGKAICLASLAIVLLMLVLDPARLRLGPKVSP